MSFSKKKLNNYDDLSQRGIHLFSDANGENIPTKSTVFINNNIALTIKPKSLDYQWDCTKEELL